MNNKKDAAAIALAKGLKKFGEQAVMRCFWPWVDSEPEAPTCILRDIPQDEYPGKGLFRHFQKTK